MAVYLLRRQFGDRKWFWASPDGRRSQEWPTRSEAVEDARAADFMIWPDDAGKKCDCLFCGGRVPSRYGLLR